MVGGHVDLDPPRQAVLCRHQRDQLVDVSRRPGDHRLPRGGVHRHRHQGLRGDQSFGGVGVEFQQCHRALTGQPRHQPGSGRDHLQSLGRG